MQIDPLAEHPSQYDQSPYQFGWNNPATLNDPSGLCPECPPETYIPIANHVYEAELGDKTSNGWEVIRVDQHDSGYQGALYKGTYNDKTQYIYATAGTQDLGKDGIGNAKQVFGSSIQYQESSSHAVSLKDEYAGVSFTGHSLGGGLASLNALKIEGKAITFNAAGLSKATKDAHGVSGNTANIRAYIAAGDPVDKYQRKIGLRAEGSVIELPSFGKALDRHSMDNIQGGFDAQKEFLKANPNIKKFIMN